MMGKLAVIETLAQSIYFTSYWKVLVLFFFLCQIVGPSDGSSYIIDYYGARLTRLTITNATFRKMQTYPWQPWLWQGEAQIHRCSWIHWNCWGFTDHPRSEWNIKCKVNKGDKMWKFLTWTSLPQRWNFGTALILGADSLLLSYIICESADCCNLHWCCVCVI